MRVNLVFYGHWKWVLGDIASHIERYNPDIEFVRSELPVDADVHHIFRPNGVIGEIPDNVLVCHHGQGVRWGELMYQPKDMDVFRSATMICVLNMQDMASLVQAGVDPDKCRYIPHGVDIERFTDVDKTDVKKWRIIRVGRRYAERLEDRHSHEQKGSSTLYELADLYSDDHEVEFVILAGDGTNGKWDETGNVKVRSVPYSEIHLEYQRADIFFSPSRSEGGPASLMEAMACGVPVVTTPVGMPKDIVVHGETGLFFNINDACGARDAIEEIRSNENGWWYDDEQRERSRIAAMNYTWEGIARRYRAAYMEIVNRPSHYTNTRTWVGGELARTRCLSEKELHSDRYSELIRQYSLSGKGRLRDWEYPAVVDEIEGVPHEVDSMLIVGAANDLLALELCRLRGKDVTCIDPEGFDGWWFEDDDRAIVRDTHPDGLDLRWSKSPEYFSDEIENVALGYETYDVAVSISVLEHVEDKVRFLKSISNALRVGGRLIMTFEYTPYTSAEIKKLKLMTIDRIQIQRWVGMSGFKFVGGQDWNTRPGSDRMDIFHAPHLRDRFTDRKIPYLCPMITVLEKVGV